MDSFIKSTRPPPEPVSISQQVRDRGSIFVAHIYRASTVEQAKRCINHQKHVAHRSKLATHEIAAWRCMILKPGSTGLSSPDDFELKSGSDDDGEKWAGNRVLKVMQSQAVIDAVVIVSRWYGGIMLGPTRFVHIETCAQEACREFKKLEELQDSITMLSSFDDLLAQLRSDLKREGSSPGSPADKETKNPNYCNLDLAKTKRLIAARENSIKACKNLLAKQHDY